MPVELLSSFGVLPQSVGVRRLPELSCFGVMVTGPISKIFIAEIGCLASAIRDATALANRATVSHGFWSCVTNPEVCCVANYDSASMTWASSALRRGGLPRSRPQAWLAM
jgi:hypothetical protein